MRNFISILVFMFVVGGASNAFSKDIVVELRGTDLGTEISWEDLGVPIPEGFDLTQDDKPLCYTIDMFSLRSGRKIGTATDCIFIYGVVEGPIVKVIGTTFFNFRKGTLVARGLTTVAPIPAGWTTGGNDFTHTTGALPGNSEVRNILSGTKRFAHATGQARLSGALNLSGFNGMAGSPMTFSCIFVISLD
jgi:hypothetical protein